MATAQCPNCGAEYDPSGISTICSKCQQALPATPQPAPAPGGATVSSASERRPCVKCGEPLYKTEMTCWKCGAAQVAAPAAPVGPRPPMPAGPVPQFPPGPGVPPPPAPGGYPGYAPPPPGVPMYPTGPSPEAEQMGNKALIWGIVSLFCCSLVTGPIAIYMGHQARQEGAGGTATAGMVLGIVSTVLSLIGLIFYIVMFAVAGSQSGGFPTPTP